MAKDFNDLFNDFLRDNEERSKKSNKEQRKDGDFFDKLIKMFDNLRGNENEMFETNEPFNLEKIFSDEPTKIEYYKDGDMYVEKRIWISQNGGSNIVKVLMSDKPVDGIIYTEINDIYSTLLPPSLDQEYLPSSPKSLEDKLKEAIENENYEEAARIRDEIEKTNK